MKIVDYDPKTFSFDPNMSRQLLKKIGEEVATMMDPGKVVFMSLKAINYIRTELGLDEVGSKEYYDWKLSEEYMNSRKDEEIVLKK